MTLADTLREEASEMRAHCACGKRTDQITACDDCDRRMCVWCASDEAWDSNVCDACREERKAMAEADGAQDAPVIALIDWNEQLLHDDTVELTAAARRELAALLMRAKAVAGAGSAHPAPAVSQGMKPQQGFDMSVSPLVREAA